MVGIMIDNVSDSSFVEIDSNQLIALSNQWVSSAQNNSKLKKKIDIIKSIEKGVRALLDSGHTYDAVSKKLKDDLNFEISAGTLKQYLHRINEQQNKNPHNSKKISQPLPRLPVSVSDLTQQPISSLSDSIANIPSVTETVADVENSDRPKPVSEVKPNSKDSSSKPQSIVPKFLPVDDDYDDDLAQQKILKHFNRY